MIGLGLRPDLTTQLLSELPIGLTAKVSQTIACFVNQTVISNYMIAGNVNKTVAFVENIKILPCCYLW